MKWRKQLPFGVYSVLLSIAVGLTLWLVQITGEAAAILAALALELVIVCHRILFQVEKADDPLRGLVRSAKVDEALATAREILRSGNPHARRLLEGTVERFSQRVKSLRSGALRCSPAEFMDFAEQLLESSKAGDKLCATSHLAGGEYWQRNYGQLYEALNRAAHARGLAIERIYLLRDQAHLDQVRDVLDRQSAFSDIKIVLLDGLDDSISAPRRDFFVYNLGVSAEFVFAEPNMSVEGMDITTESERVQELGREFSRIRALSRPYQSTAAAGTP